MRYLILSDIHGNWEALEAVLQEAEGEWERAVCCGDLVGYGADPNRVVEWVREHVAAAVRGNHDKASVGLEDLAWFNPAAREAAEWTGAELTAENERYLRRLPRGPLEVGGFQILHGSPVDEDEYLMTADAGLASHLGAALSFFGHTHWQGGFAFHRRAVERLRAVPAGLRALPVRLEPDCLYLINPGSVGQPRDGDPRAAYALYDEGGRLVELRRTPYRISIAQAKIRRAGLPSLLADRLAQGV